MLLRSVFIEILQTYASSALSNTKSRECNYQKQVNIGLCSFENFTCDTCVLFLVDGSKNKKPRKVFTLPQNYEYIFEGVVNKTTLIRTYTI